MIAVVVVVAVDISSSSFLAQTILEITRHAIGTQKIGGRSKRGKYEIPWPN
jgi:hypothetical protein